MTFFPRQTQKPDDRPNLKQSSRDFVLENSLTLKVFKLNLSG
jgi:hypothetical protein